MPTGRLPRLRGLLWLLLALPGLWQLNVLGYAVRRRFGYPYDLEWMEGGILAHVQRYAAGQDIYVPPSVEFTAFPYTPLYAAVVALVSKLVGVSYQTGRAVSVAAMLATVGLGAVALLRETRDRWLSIAAAIGAAGFYAAAYPWTEGWFDIVRGDSLFVALGLAGLVMVRRWGTLPGERLRGYGHPRMALAGAVLALSFFTKQTGIFFVLAGGAALLVLNWRALASYAAGAGLLGLGGVAVLNAASQGWFWIYVFGYFAQHEVSPVRFRQALGEMLGHFPVMTGVIAATLALVALVFARRRKLPEGGAGFLYWSGMFAVAVLIGCLGWAKQWAHPNVYTPSMVFGGIAAGAGVIALAGCAEELGLTRWAPTALAVLALGAIGAQQFRACWKPHKWIPSDKDRRAGDRLIARIRSLPGEVFVPFHPFYSVIAGKRPYVHRMSIMEVTYRPPPGSGRKAVPLERAHRVEGLYERLRERHFAAVILDDRGQVGELPGLLQGYEKHRLPPDESPRVVTGAHTVPWTLWLPKGQPKPPDL